VNEKINRRDMIWQAGACAGAGLAAAAGLSTGAASDRAPAAPQRPFRFCLNTGTIMGHKLPLPEQCELAAKAGYDGIEPWVRDIQRYAEEGGSLPELNKRVADLGIVVESAIGFPAWAVDDDGKRESGFEQMKREMDVVRGIGGRRIAAPPAGINRTPGVDLLRVAERYRAVLELGREMGVVPQLEIWGSAQTLGRPGEAALVAIQANHPDACLLLDVVHIYKSGSGFDGLRLLSGGALHVFHVNDYPADPPRETATDADRIFPGDGVAPMAMILRTLYETGFRGALSLELFNRTYWEQDPLTVAKTGLEKMKAAAAKALG
jgi:2-keto-myo-inositol isomerase